jgi:hypothetical protein
MTLLARPCVAGHERDSLGAREPRLGDRADEDLLTLPRRQAAEHGADERARREAEGGARLGPRGSPGRGRHALVEHTRAGRGSELRAHGLRRARERVGAEQEAAVAWPPAREVGVDLAHRDGEGEARAGRGGVGADAHRRVRVHQCRLALARQPAQRRAVAGELTGDTRQPPRREQRAP